MEETRASRGSCTRRRYVMPKTVMGMHMDMKDKWFI